MRALVAVKVAYFAIAVLGLAINAYSIEASRGDRTFSLVAVVVCAAGLLWGIYELLKERH